MNEIPKRIILAPEFIGHAAHGDDGILRIGTPRTDGSGVVEIRLSKGDFPGWWYTNTVGVYVCRFSTDLSVAEIHIAQHDGLASAELEFQNEQADIYPLGPKEYWRTELVGKAICGIDKHAMTNEEFEDDWNSAEEEYFFDDFDDLDDFDSD